MDKLELIQRIRSLIVENLETDLPEQISESDRIYEDLHIDSIMVLQLTVYIEEELGITVPEEEVDPAVFETIGSFVDFLQDLRQEQVS